MQRGIPHVCDSSEQRQLFFTAERMKGLQKTRKLENTRFYPAFFYFFVHLREKFSNRNLQTTLAQIEFFYEIF